MNLSHLQLAGATETVAADSTSAQSAAAANDVDRLVVADVDCHIAVDANPTASSATFYLPAKSPLVLRLRKGQKVAAIRVTTTGSLFLTDVAVY